MTEIDIYRRQYTPEAAQMPLPPYSLMAGAGGIGQVGEVAEKYGSDLLKRTIDSQGKIQFSNAQIQLDSEFGDYKNWLTQNPQLAADEAQNFTEFKRRFTGRKEALLAGVTNSTAKKNVGLYFDAMVGIKSEGGQEYLGRFAQEARDYSIAKIMEKNKADFDANDALLKSAPVDESTSFRFVRLAKYQNHLDTAKAAGLENLDVPSVYNTKMHDSVVDIFAPLIITEAAKAGAIKPSAAEKMIEAGIRQITAEVKKINPDFDFTTQEVETIRRNTLTSMNAAEAFAKNNLAEIQDKYARNFIDKIEKRTLTYADIQNAPKGVNVEHYYNAYNNYLEAKNKGLPDPAEANSDAALYGKLKLLIWNNPKSVSDIGITNLYGKGLTREWTVDLLNTRASRLDPDGIVNKNKRYFDAINDLDTKKMFAPSDSEMEKLLPPDQYAAYKAKDKTEERLYRESYAVKRRVEISNELEQWLKDNPNATTEQKEKQLENLLTLPKQEKAKSWLKALFMSPVGAGIGLLSASHRSIDKWETPSSPQATSQLPIFDAPDIAFDPYWKTLSDDQKRKIWAAYNNGYSADEIINTIGIK